MRGVILIAVALAVSGCSVRLHGHESVSGGVRTTTTSSAVAGSVKAGNARLSVSSGQPVAANARGGHIAVSGDVAAVLLIGLVVVDAMNYFTARFSAPPAIQRSTAVPLSETCSCYGNTAGSPPVQ